jgi:shikimate 5-dehydrogenase
MPLLQPALTPTMYFIGVTTGSSSIMRVFPRWAEHLGLDAAIAGIDLPLDAEPSAYREVVSFIKGDPLSLGALVTTHKLNLFKASRDLFDGVGEDTRLLDEVSSISKRGRELWGHAMDSLTSGLSLLAIVGEDAWRSGEHLVLLGAGGSSLALTLFLHRQQAAGLPVPERVVVTNRREHRLAEMRQIHEAIGFAIPIDYVLAPEPRLNDAVVTAAPSGSVVVNATGLGKDRPGSPLTDAVSFPAGAVVWDFNYRGDLVFLDQAKAQAASAGLGIEDGWLYFLHGWTRVISEVFHIDIPTAGPEFDRLGQIAREATQKG